MVLRLACTMRLEQKNRRPDEITNLASSKRNLHRDTLQYFFTHVRRPRARRP